MGCVIDISTRTHTCQTQSLYRTVSHAVDAEWRGLTSKWVSPSPRPMLPATIVYNSFKAVLNRAAFLCVILVATNKIKSLHIFEID